MVTEPRILVNMFNVIFWARVILRGTVVGNT